MGGVCVDQCVGRYSLLWNGTVPASRQGRI